MFRYDLEKEGRVLFLFSSAELVDKLPYLFIHPIP